MVDIHGLSSLQRRVKRMERKLESNTKRVANESLNEIRADARANLFGLDAIAHAITLNSFRTRRLTSGKKQSFILQNYSPHAGFVEYGTGLKNLTYDNLGNPAPTYRAPALTDRLVHAIERWIAVKGITAYRVPQDRLALAIATKISRMGIPHGTPARQFMTDAYIRQEPLIKQRFRNAVKRAV